MTRLACRGLGWQVDDRWIVRDITTEVAEGCCTALVGMNGSGKTTLLQLLCGLRKPSRGQVLVDDRRLTDMSRREIARTMALMEQLPQARVALTARDVVALGRIPHEGRWQLNAHGARVDDRSWNTLSGGERQRVQLARALAQEPQVLMLDEPTNHLDLHHQIALLRIVTSLRLTTLVVLHDLDLAAAFADRLIVLDDGHLVAQGPTDEVLTAQLVAERFAVRGQVSRTDRLRFSWQGLVSDGG
ncbi:ABC transporter, iron transport ATPase protein [Propionibacterium freudenreichii]|uniref:ABC transporter ATP-binding protein n=1 Tax=Propionibacterium freudenreichii TaxID=1744 RepID=UPI0005A5D019|nr:ABC transporter ATP-binding protein [Propionibacterium freudenreichii]MDK9661452.1 ABC transporter ATP-binding protein [Propionibacterium freudenreichii]CEI24725.1 ABC transporter, iron transport ATPase protein [Propionibacterium freudenreichii]SBN96638.1 ABC transporter (Iron.B12.siderophore.hemin) ATP-binding component [Propionibacterium freudenreichii]SBT30320.1 ABC transporter (Iron.B12.siderophore.hemin) ATP-binding component [Propionibacterium freudenreichii]SCC98223.1 ABC transporter